MGLALGLAAALCWGFGDYCATLASRRTGELRTLLGMHAVSLVALAIGVGATGALGAVGGSHALVLFGVGALGAAAYLLFYRALAIGPISIVSPIVSGYAAVMVVLAVLLLDERLGGGEIAAVAAVMLGVVVSSADVRAIRRIERVALLGLVFAVLAMIGIGGFVFGVSYYSEDLGWLAPIFLGRVFTAVFLVGAALRGGRWRFPDRSPVLGGLLLALGALDTLGYVAFNIGVREAETSLVSTAAAPYAAVPIVLGVLVLRERPAPIQWGGIALVVAGLVLLGLAS